MKKNLFIIFINLFVLINVSFSQELVLSGTITNSVTKQGIGNALIEVKDKPLSIYSDADGFYSIIVPDGFYNIIVSAKGMHTQNIKLSKKNIETEELNVQLDPKAEDKLYDMSLEELLNVKVEVSTKKAVSLHETPSIVTVVTKEDIQKSGCRDLKEILELFVPGVQFGYDVEGVVGIGIRGMWAHEGKTLMLIDGTEMNEEMFANLFLGNHYNPDIIKKIEISRGPGSAIYGGYAGLSVINIITKDAKSNGGYVSSLYSQMSKNFSHRNVNFGYGKEIGDFNFSINTSLGQGNRSQENIIDYSLDTMSMNNNSGINTAFINLNIGYKGLKIHAISDFYHYKQIDLWGSNYKNGALSESNDTHASEISYTFNISKTQKITPKISFKYQEPWKLDVPDEDYVNSKYNTKYTGGIIHQWEFTPKINLLTGIEYYQNSLILPENHKDYEETFINNKDNLTTNNISAFSQLIFFNNIANLTIGGRFDNSTEYGNSFVPRIALTKQFKGLHIKAMGSQSFRIPGGIIPNRIPEGADKITPEKGNIFEFETGYQFLKNFYIGANAFLISFNKIISYGSTPSGIGTYVNSGTMGTKGIEAEFKYRGNFVNVMLNYAYYMADNKDVENYLVPQHENYYLSFTPQRLNAFVSINFTDKISLNITGNYFGKRYGYTHADTNGNDILEEFEQKLLIGSNFQINKIFNVFNFTLGVSNILDTKMHFIQAYHGGTAPLPSHSRAYYLKLFLNF